MGMNPSGTTEAMLTDDGFVGASPQPFSQDACWKIGFAAATYLRSVLLGYDRSDPNINRIVIGHGPGSAAAEHAGAASRGVLCSDYGSLELGEVCWGEVSAWMARERCAGGLMVWGAGPESRTLGVSVFGQGGRQIFRESGLAEIGRISSRLTPHPRPPIRVADRGSAAAMLGELLLKWGDWSRWPSGQAGVADRTLELQVPQARARTILQAVLKKAGVVAQVSDGSSSGDRSERAWVLALDPSSRDCRVLRPGPSGCAAPALPWREIAESLLTRYRPGADALAMVVPEADEALQQAAQASGRSVVVRRLGGCAHQRALAELGNGVAVDIGGGVMHQALGGSGCGLLTMVMLASCLL